MNDDAGAVASLAVAIAKAYGLLKRHLERSLDDGDVLVLNRNNSHDRLEPMTEIDAGSALHDLLQA